MKRCLSCCPFGGMTPKGLGTHVKTRACIKRLRQRGQFWAKRCLRNQTCAQTRAEPMWVN